MTKTICKGTKKDGSRCNAPAGPGGYCTFHAPHNGRALAEGRKRGGERHRTPHGAIDAATLPGKVRTLADVLSVLDYALSEALAGENSIARGRLLVAIAGAFIEAIKTGELEQRIQAIEAALKVKPPEPTPAVCTIS